jgi:hypothetical protein
MISNVSRLLRITGRLSDDDVRVVARVTALGALMAHAAHLRDLGHGASISYSAKSSSR